jgi:hypothetical protein
MALCARGEVAANAAPLTAIIAAIQMIRDRFIRNPEIPLVMK